MKKDEALSFQKRLLITLAGTFLALLIQKTFVSTPSPNPNAHRTPPQAEARL